ncbi:MAG: hypothetical protein AAGA83_06440 [Cyanobacteria bacterium P01_F01_bin.116]
MSVQYPDGLSREEWLTLIEERRNPFFRYPTDLNMLVWRYVDFAKFVSLLDSSSIFFPRATLFDDPFEGSVSRVNLDQRQSEIETGIQNALTHATIRDPNWRASARAQLQAFDRLRSAELEWQRNWTYISCWHANPHESAAMWKLYGVHQEAVAIVSTFTRLKEALSPHVIPPHGEPKLGLVNYVDYENEPVEQMIHLSEYFFKRKSFEHEAELRAVIQDLPLKPTPDSKAFHYDFSVKPVPGRSLSIDLEVLIQDVRVAPAAAGWFYELVKNVVRKYGLSCPVIRSKLDESPVF